MNNSIFSFLREDSSIEDIYDVGPWAEDDVRYLESDVNERLHHEILDIARWLEPTESEKKIRLIVITRFTNIIEKFYPGSIAIPQGSSATDTYLPISDIDLIVLNVPGDDDTSNVLRTLTKFLIKSKMVSNYKIIDHANVPIIKIKERPFGFNIDICITNINGALNIPRVRKILTLSPLIRPILMFFKLFIYANKIDDPSVGGFGSNQIINLILFGFQSRPDLADNAGQMVLYLLDVLANKINYFLVGISTRNDGRLFSKRKLELMTATCPQAFVFEDPQFQDNFIGTRTSHSLILISKCRTALHSIAHCDYVKRSAITSFLPDIDELLDRRYELEKFGRIFEKSLYEFSHTIDEIPTYIPHGQHFTPPFIQRGIETKQFDAKKVQQMKDRKKRKKEERKQQIFQNQLKALREKEERKAKKQKGQKTQKHPKPPPNRNKSPSRFRR